MKKVAMFLLIALLVSFNPNVVQADTEKVSAPRTSCKKVTTSRRSSRKVTTSKNIYVDNPIITLGKQVVNSDFSKTFTIYNPSSSPRKINIEIGYNNLGLKLNSTKFDLGGNQHKTVTVTGHFPEYPNSFLHTLRIKDDSSKTDDIYVTINGESTPKGTATNTSSGQLPKIKNVKITRKSVSQDYFEYTITWDKYNIDGVKYMVRGHYKDKHQMGYYYGSVTDGNSFKLLQKKYLDFKFHNKLIIYISAYKKGYSNGFSDYAYGPVIGRGNKGINDCEEAKKAEKECYDLHGRRRRSMGGKTGTSRGHGTGSGRTGSGRTGGTRRTSATGGTGSGTGRRSRP